MKRIAGATLIILALAALVGTQAYAQTEERGEFGVYADYTRLHNADNANFWGVGGRLAVNLNRWAQLEGGMAYDFERNFTTGTPGLTGTFTRSGLKILNGLFGPKFQAPLGPVKLFVTAKGGFVNFSVSRAVTFGNFGGAVTNIPSGNTNGAFYPGGGVELFYHWIGVRAEAGDLMYFDHGTNHNLSFNIGPQFRF